METPFLAEVFSNDTKNNRQARTSRNVHVGNRVSQLLRIFSFDEFEFQNDSRLYSGFAREREATRRVQSDISVSVS